MASQPPHMSRNHSQGCPGPIRRLPAAGGRLPAEGGGWWGTAGAKPQRAKGAGRRRSRQRSASPTGGSVRTTASCTRTRPAAW